MAIPNVVGNIAGGAQAQRFAVANFERENAAAKARAAKQLQDSILTGLLNTGIQTAVGFGEKAYDEAHKGARDQQALDDAKAVDQFNMRVKRLDALVNAPSFDDAMKVKQDAIGSTGYGMEQETAADRSPMVSAARELAKARDSAPETGYGRMGRMGIDGGPSAAEGSPVSREARPSPSPVNLGSGQRDMGAPSQPVLVQRARTDDEALAAMPEGDDRAFQARLLEAKRQAAAAAVAAAAKAKQDREDAQRKQLLDAQLKSDQNMGELQQRTEQKLGPRGRPTNVPQFGVQPVVDPETGIVRPRFVEQPRVQMPATGGGGGGAKPAYPPDSPMNTLLDLYSYSRDKRGLPLTGQLNANRDSIAATLPLLIKDPSRFGYDAPDQPELYRLARIINDQAKKGDVAGLSASVASLKALHDRVQKPAADAWAKMQTGKARDSNEVATAATEKATAQERQAEADALAKAKDEVAAAEAEKKRQLDLLAVQQEALRHAMEDINIEFDVAKAKTLHGVRFTKDQAARARAGEPMPEDFPSPDAWNAVARDGSAIQKVRKAKEALLGSVPPRPVRGAPQQAAAPQAQAPKFTTPAEVQAAFKAGKITRADAAAAFKALGIDVED